MSKRYEIVRHSEHKGSIGHIDHLLDVVHCEWCAVGWSEQLKPHLSIQRHFEAAHPKAHRNMWEEHDND